VGWQTSFSYSLHFSASAGQVWQIIRSNNEVRCVPIHWRDNQDDPGLSLGFWSLVRRPGVVYVSGDCRRPNTQESLNGYFSPQLLEDAFPPRGASEPAYGFILRLSTGTSFAHHPCSRYWQESGYHLHLHSGLMGEVSFYLAIRFSFW
jgi:hypothetical protein